MDVMIFTYDLSIIPIMSFTQKNYWIQPDELYSAISQSAIMPQSCIYNLEDFHMIRN
jgi:hypothetical protein